MYRDWVLIGLAIVLLCLLVYITYRLVYQIPEGFITTPATTNYTMPDLSGVLGRYVRIRPSLTGDGYLTISQIQVLDINGANIALKQPTFATSQGGNPVDQIYGNQLLNFTAAQLGEQSYAQLLLGSFRGQNTITYAGQSQYLSGTQTGAAQSATPEDSPRYASLGPDCVVDGTIRPRRSLMNVFETSVPNYTTVSPNYSTINTMNAGSSYVPKDNQYWQVDLGKDQLIQHVIYTGQEDPINTTGFSQVDNPFRTIDSQGRITYYNINQVDRLNGMRLEIYSSNKVLVFSSTFKKTDSVQILSIPNVITATTSQTTQTIAFVPDISGLYQLAKPYSLDQTDFAAVNNERQALQTYAASLLPPVKDYYPPPSRPTKRTKLMAIVGKPYISLPINPYDGINHDIFSSLQSNYPVMFNEDILVRYTDTAPKSPITTHILGSASAQAQAEFSKSIEYCKSIYLAEAGLVHFFIGLTYNSDPLLMIPYIRNSGSNLLCMPPIINVSQSTGITAKESRENQSWNLSYCSSVEITPALLALLPYITRSYIIEWIYGRSIRYTTYTKQFIGANYTVSGSSATIVKMVASKYGIDFTSYKILDSIAQQFYEFLGGNYAMTYIYDALPLGSTMVDVRFDLTIHNGSNSESNAAIDDLKAQYKSIITSRELSEDVLQQARVDYTAQLPKLQLDEINDTIPPLEGAVARMFYTKSGDSITITGMILDQKSVTSFIPELNGGLSAPLGSADGNVNYTPTIMYTKNVTETLNCSDPETINRMINDYRDAVETYPYILKGASKPIDTTNKNLYVDSVIGVAQISPTQCALRWVEILYDPSTNIAQPRPIQGSGTIPCPWNTALGFQTCKAGSSASAADAAANPCILCAAGPTSTTRNVLLNYVPDITSWFSNELTFDVSGIVILPSTSIPNCTFDPFDYQTSIFPRLANLDRSATSKKLLTDDFLSTSFKLGTAPVCPKDISGYRFDPANYVAANRTSTLNTAMNDFMKTGIYNGAVIRSSTQITSFTEPLSIVKPVAAKTNLDSKSGTCPITSCEDLDVLFSIADQYNTNASYPGTILRITSATTPNPYQCDIKVDINYSALIVNMLNQTLITKGTVEYKMDGSRITERITPLPSNLVGVKNGITIATYLSLNQADCSYILQDASGMNSGHSIQENTPDLYKPMVFSEMLAKYIVDNTGSSLSTLHTDIVKAGSSANTVLTSYVANTNDAVRKLTGVSTPAISPFTDYQDPYPLRAHGFGRDMARNSIDSHTKTQYTLPLKQDLPLPTMPVDTPAYKFLRFRTLQTRDANSPFVALSNITFFNAGKPVSLSSTRVTNPLGTWQGTAADLASGRGWYDDHKSPLIFAWPAPILVNSYSITTSDLDPAGDPSSWKIDASPNGTYWKTIDYKNATLSLERGKEVPPIFFDPPE